MCMAGRHPSSESSWHSTAQYNTIKYNTIAAQHDGTHELLQSNLGHEVTMHTKQNNIMQVQYSALHNPLQLDCSSTGRTSYCSPILAASSDELAQYNTLAKKCNTRSTMEPTRCCSPILAARLSATMEAEMRTMREVSASMPARVRVWVIVMIIGMVRTCGRDVDYQQNAQHHV